MVETNVALRLFVPGDPMRRPMIRKVVEMRRDGFDLMLLPQVVMEAWTVLTRSTASNGLGMSAPEADRVARQMRQWLPLLAAGEADVLREWQALVDRLSIRGTRCYDARIVAAMCVHGINDILTADAGFRRYGVTVHRPDPPPRAEVAAAVADPGYPWFADLARTLNSGQSRSVLLHGPVHDLYYDGDAYVPLPQFLTGKCAVGGIVQLVYELNGPLRTHPADAADALRAAWVRWKTGQSPDDLAIAAMLDRGKLNAADHHGREFDRLVAESTGQPTVALEFLRQLTMCSRAAMRERLLIWVEAADLLIPGTGGEDITRLGPADRQRVVVLRDWFGDVAFQDGEDSVVLLSESRGGVHRLVTSLPQVLDIAVPAPDAGRRRHFIEQFDRPATNDAKLPDGEERQGITAKLWAGPEQVAAATAGLSVHALRQLLRGAAYGDRVLQPADVVGKVESFIQGRLGEDVVEFKRPAYSLDDVVGNARLKDFLQDEFIPRVQSTGDDALPGAAVAGPIGAGKTFVFEAVAGELGVPVLVLKNVRSQWYGQTDVLFETLRGVLSSLGRVVIFVDEADTAFGGVGEGAHETERRLTGKVQQMMSDPALRGRVTWLLMTARIHRLSPDIRRPGRVGDLIIPVLDPTGQDRLDFIAWMLRGVVDGDPQSAAREIEPDLAAESAAAVASLRSRLKARANRDGPLTGEQVREVAADFLPPAIGPTRRYQELQALVNTTRRSLLPDPDVTDEAREAWHAELRSLERAGVE